jgi:multidrug efflux system outer membrane protein
MAFLILSLSLAGCGEPYVRPALPVSASWDDVGQARPDDIVATKTEWKQFFTDPQLQALINSALEHNRDFRIAAARIEEARSLLGLARAEAYPNVTLGGGFNAALSPGNLGGSNQSVTGKQVNISLTTISYELDFWGRISGLGDVARASLLASESSRHALRITLISEVANNYFGLLDVKERIAIVRELKDLAHETAELVGRAQKAGYAPLNELLQAQMAMESVRTNLATLEREQASSINLLQFLAGNVPKMSSAHEMSMQIMPGEIEVGLPAEVLLARPDVMAAEQRLIGANANIGAARAAFLPKILLTGMLGMASKSLATLFATGSQSWAFQPTLSLPLFDGGRTAENAELAEVRKVVAVAEYEKTIQQAFWEVANLLAARSALSEQVGSAEASLKIQEGRRKVAESLYRSGQTGFLDVLESKREVLTARMALVQLRRQSLSVKAQLYKAFGGGA